LIDGREPVTTPQRSAESPVAFSELPSEVAHKTTVESTATPTSSAESHDAMGPINSREDAYRMLEAVAQYLQKTEPHSPTPYLVMRAVTWGRMSLGDLMQEIVREEGDMNRYFSLLGIKEPRG
jgi:type VI secretion system protein ImpA